MPDKVRSILKHELQLIERLDYAPYFLTVNSIVRFARSQDTLCQGRGSAAISAVCYVLGITSIDPDRNGLLFERFISVERREPPDINVDFEHERREIVMQWVFEIVSFLVSCYVPRTNKDRVSRQPPSIFSAKNIPDIGIRRRRFKALFEACLVATPEAVLTPYRSVIWQIIH